MNYDKICDEILELNQNIRYAAVYDYGELHDKIKPGVKSHLSREETETSLSQAIYRWSTRKKTCLLYTSPSPRDGLLSRMPSSA